ncbi:hypothetical protein ACKI2C_50905, partial [Streptomyces brasiliscabiei]
FGKHATYYFNSAVENELQSNFLAFADQLHADTRVTICSRTIECLQRSNNAIMFDFMALCAGPRSTADYIYLAQHYQRVYVCNIP